MLRFLGPSLIGVCAFLVPVDHGDGRSILIGLLSDWVKVALEPFLLPMVVVVCVVSVLGGAWYVARQPAARQINPFLNAMCNVTPIWLALRTVGAAIGLMVLFDAGPEVLRGDATGAGVFRDIGVNSLVILLVACQLMPFLTEFGFMEFVGTLLKGPFERLFRLPGRSAIDATASFVSAAAVGLLITIGQYERGYYTAREAAAIATNFSVVSIPFSLVVAEVAGIADVYFAWYLTVVTACLVCALVMVRIPPLTRIADDYFPPTGRRTPPVADDSNGVVAAALRAASARAAGAPGPRALIRGSLLQSIDVIFGVIPVAMCLATLTAVLVFHTPVFDVLATPIYWLISLAGLPEAGVAAPGFIAGFLDQFMPALIARNIDSEVTRFVLAGLSISQLIFMAEVGVLILRSSLPLGLVDLALIFLLRTVIVLPIFLVAARWLL